MPYSPVSAVRVRKIPREVLKTEGEARGQGIVMLKDCDVDATTCSLNTSQLNTRFPWDLE